MGGRSYVDAIVLGPDNVRGAQAAGWYDDVLVQTDDGWKIARRRFTLVRMQVIEPGWALIANVAVLFGAVVSAKMDSERTPTP